MKIKIVSWNIWRGKNLEQVIKFLKNANADVIGLQEVIEPESKENQAEVIANSLGYHFIYCKAFETDRHKTKYGIGNAILSRYPLEEAQCLMLSDLEDYQGTSQTEPRGMVKVKIKIGTETLNIFCTHLSFNDDNLNSSKLQIIQAEKLLSFLPKEKTILIGDFNSQPDCEVVKKISEVLINTDKNPTEPSWKYVEGPGKYSNLRIDYIFTSPDLNYSDFQVLESEASDHKPLSVEVDINTMDSYSEKVISLRGQAGAMWLREIPGILSEFEKKWGLKIGKQLDSYINYVTSAEDSDGNEVILKIYFPDEKEFAAETEALKVFNGQGIARLLKDDRDKKVVLLEMVKPGEPVSDLEDDSEATKIIAQTMKKIWKPAPDSNVFPTLIDWSKEFKWYYENAAGDVPLSRDLVKEAEKIFVNMAENPNGRYLLHGDLHHGNVLSSDMEKWLAIDPKGLIGEREYETAAMLRNPLEKLVGLKNLKEVLNKRLDILTEVLGFERERMLKWGFAQTVLSIIWNMQGDRERWSDWVAVAEALHDLLLKVVKE